MRGPSPTAPEGLSGHGASSANFDRTEFRQASRLLAVLAHTPRRGPGRCAVAVIDNLSLWGDTTRKTTRRSQSAYTEMDRFAVILIWTSLPLASTASCPGSDMARSLRPGPEQPRPRLSTRPNDHQG